MLGAIAGDIVGSIYELNPIKTVDFPLFSNGCCFTDDSVMTVAIAHAILEQIDYGNSMKAFGRQFPNAGYGSSFYEWIFEPEIRPYFSWGNGSAMRVSPVGCAFDTIDEVLREAHRSAEVSHNHPEGIKGAQAVALAVFLARKGVSKEDIRQEIGDRFDYDLQHHVAEIRSAYHFDVSCQGTVPAALIAFFDSESYEDAIRQAISLGGDSDTLACITGGIAHAFYRTLPLEIATTTRSLLPDIMLSVVDKFSQKFDL